MFRPRDLKLWWHGWCIRNGNVCIQFCYTVLDCARPSFSLCRALVSGQELGHDDVTLRLLTWDELKGMNSPWAHLWCSFLYVDKKFSLFSSPSPRNPSLKQQLFSYAILGFALSEAMGLFCLMVAFLILFAMCKSHLHFLEFFLQHFICIVCPFSYTTPDSLGKVIGSGFDRGKTSKYCINKKYIK